MRRVYRYWASDGSPRRARKAVRNAVLAWECGEDVADVAELLTSEVATNAVVHAPASSEYIVEVDVSDGFLTVSVTDFGGGRPHATQARADDEHGRGLAMVRDLSDAWGIEAVGGLAKRVFFRLTVKPIAQHVREREARYSEAMGGTTGSGGSGGTVERETRGDSGVPRFARTPGLRRLLRPGLRWAW